MLAMQAAGSTDPPTTWVRSWTSPTHPGEQILPGELGKALEMIANGERRRLCRRFGRRTDRPGESAGNYREIEIEGGELTVVGFR
jgi:branched-chain amino acid transport system substrate-binding protein